MQCPAFPEIGFSVWGFSLIVAESNAVQNAKCGAQQAEVDMQTLIRGAVALVLLIILTIPPAQASVSVSVSGNTVSADISIGSVEADFSLEFENAVGLNASSIGISASVINPLSISLLDRLPSGFSIPAVVPLKIVVEPPDDEGLSFTDTVKVELHTHALSLVTNSPLRLMKAPLGGDFVDITESLASGSVRSRGRTGAFSEFVLAIDVRSHTSVAALKLDDLDDQVDDTDIPVSIRTTLQGYVDAADIDLGNGDYLDAIAELEDLIDEVETNAGSNIPNVWRASRDLDNVAGRIISQAKTLIFSLRMANALTLP